MMTRSVFVGWMVLILSGAAQASARDVAERAEAFNTWLGVSEEGYLDTPIRKKVPGVRNIKTVLPGVLYRAGGPGGQTSLKDVGLRGLCEAGFAEAVYLYPNGFPGTQTVNCTGPDGKPNALTYVQMGYLTPSEKKRILNDVYVRIQDSSAGPTLVHCWNGYHASGEIAAVALRQFCGYTASMANAYWMKNQKGAKMISRISKFQDFSEMRLTADLQQAICPRE